MTMPSRATRCSTTTPMACNFKVSERVVVDVKGFEPWPATIQCIVLNEEEKDVNYHVKLDGSSKTIPTKKENIRQLGVTDAQRYEALSPDELWHGARKRLEVIEGVYISMFSEDGIQSSLWNYVSVENNFEKVPDLDKAKLKLSRVAHNAHVRFKELESKFTIHAAQNKMLLKEKNETDGYRHVFEKVGRKSVSSQMVIRFPCPMCMKKFKTRMALKKHIECNTDCTKSKKTAKSGGQPKQCPKCFSLYKNEESLLRHMAVHEKNLPKKKSGIRDYIRQIMSNDKACRVRSFSPVSTTNRKPNIINGKLQDNQARLLNKKVIKVESPDDSEQEEEDEEGDEEEDDESDDNSTSDTDSFNTTVSKTCRVCSRQRCKCGYRRHSHRQMSVHCEREKERRRQMRRAFENLGSVLEASPNSPKNVILQLARDEIQKLEDRRKRLERTLADVKDMNIRLVTREYQLSC